MAVQAIIDAQVWKSILGGDAEMQSYFAAPKRCHGALLMSCCADDGCNLAMVDDVPPHEADAALSAIVEHYRARRATPRVRLSPFSSPDWVMRLEAAGFVETGERRRFWIAPSTVHIPVDPEIIVTRATRPAEADRFSSIQAACFALPVELHEWDRQLARQRLAEGRVRFFLGRKCGRTVGTGAVTPLANGTIGLWGLATLPDARHSGVGMSVLARMIEDARSLGGPVFFTTSWSNPIEVVYERTGCVPLFRTRTFAYRC